MSILNFVLIGIGPPNTTMTDRDGGTNNSFAQLYNVLWLVSTYSYNKFWLSGDPKQKLKIIARSFAEFIYVS